MSENDRYPVVSHDPDADPRPIRNRRVEAGLTQCELAELAGCDRRTVSRVERGEEQPGADLLARIRRVLDEHGLRRG
jgi:transcriptional regulator with XRE-family HTH domain